MHQKNLIRFLQNKDIPEDLLMSLYLDLSKNGNDEIKKMIRGKKPSFLKGGGGTHFDPVFSYIKENRFKRYDGCIYLTDGYAPEPQVKPPCKVFWLLTPDGSSDALKFGRVAKFMCN